MQIVHAAEEVDGLDARREFSVQLEVALEVGAERRMAPRGGGDKLALLEQLLALRRRLIDLVGKADSSRAQAQASSWRPPQAHGAVSQGRPGRGFQPSW